ncbi:MAG: 4Fe-4S binding protein [Ignavibacteriaceae bacterium]|nr:4Fe-4S binding protein [Ignavibacteriaceae bacterium]
MNPHVEINSNCINCGACVEACPVRAITGIDPITERYSIDRLVCNFSACGVTVATWKNAPCVQVCPVDAIQLAQEE